MLTKLSLQNFRNHKKISFDFSTGMTVFLGENGKGKTNILEAIFALSTTKVFRSNTREVFIAYGEGYAKVYGKFPDEELEVFWSMKPKKNNYKKNDISCTASEFIKEKKFLAVLFSPEDMNLPVLPPAQRRRYLSQVLSPLFAEYFEASLKYDSIIKNRNELLKKFSEGKSKKEEFLFWDEKLGQYHSILYEHRKQYFDFLSITLPKYYLEISGKNDSVSLCFQSSCFPENFAEKLKKNFEKDVFTRRTNIGSHRDDFYFLLRGVSLHEGASRGETRSVLLALKMAEKEYIEKISGNKPILLLDDVFSELDISHQQHLLESIASYQSVITTTHSEVDLEGLNATIYRV